MDGKLYSLGRPDHFPVDEDVLKHQRGADGGNGKVMAFSLKRGIQ